MDLVSVTVCLAFMLHMWEVCSFNLARRQTYQISFSLSSSVL